MGEVLASFSPPKFDGQRMSKTGSVFAAGAATLIPIRLVPKFIPLLLAPFELIQLAPVAVLPLMAKAMVSAPVPAINVGDPPKSFPILAVLVTVRLLPVILPVATKVLVFTPPLAVRLPAVSVILPTVSVTPPVFKVKFPGSIIILPSKLEFPVTVKAEEDSIVIACRSSIP